MDINNHCIHKFAWKEALSRKSPSAQWSPRPINNGEQIKVDGLVSVNLYHSGTVLVQGPHFRDWIESVFPRLKERLDTKTIPKLVEDGGVESMETPAVIMGSVQVDCSKTSPLRKLATSTSHVLVTALQFF